jgi:death-on-curing family protein
LPKSKRTYIKLDADFVQMVHDSVTQMWPGHESVERGGCRDRGLLESAVNRPFQSAFGEDAYPNLIGKAAALFHSLVANHCFVDGNKRTAVISLQNFLVLNGVSPGLSDREMYELARETASHHARGVSHTQAYNEIYAILKARKVSFSRMRSLGVRNPLILNLYKRLIDFRQAIKAVLKSQEEMRSLGIDPIEFRRLYAGGLPPQK